MQGINQNTTVSEYMEFFMFQLAAMPEGELKDSMREYFDDFNEQIEHLNNCLNLDTHDAFKTRRSDHSAESGQ